MSLLILIPSDYQTASGDAQAQQFLAVTRVIRALTRGAGVKWVRSDTPNLTRSLALVFQPFELSALVHG